MAENRRWTCAFASLPTDMLVHTCDSIPARVMKSFENAGVYSRSASLKFLQKTHLKT